MPWIILGIVISYLIGSIPTAYIFGQLLKGIDIRKFGSGNVGATNALRVLGKKVGITVLVLDILKGFTVVFFLGDFFVSKITCISGEVLRIALGLVVVLGHNWTIFLRFKGGKGVATTFGILSGLAIKIPGLRVILVLAILTWFAVFCILRIISIASVVTGISLPIYALLLKESHILIWLSVILSVLSILRHRANLKRFFQGKEPRL